MLAAPRAVSIVEGDKSSESGVDRPQMVGDVTGAHQWRASGMTAKIHQAAHGKSDDVRRFKFTIGTEKTEAANRREYESGIDRSERIEAETDFVKISGRFVLDHYVGVGQKIAKRLSITFRFKIENDAPFVRVIGGKRKASLEMRYVVLERPLATHRVAARRFNQNHRRAKIGEQQAAITAFSPGKIEDAQSG